MFGRTTFVRKSRSTPLVMGDAVAMHKPNFFSEALIKIFALSLQADVYGLYSLTVYLK
jgi:hypothetical protein